jgi:hypothetical protein
MLGIGMGKAGLLATIPIVGPLLAYNYNKGAFAEARNIQGSDAHSVLFGLKSVFVNGGDHATFSSGKKLVVTADERVELDSRGKTEVAGAKVLVTAADAVDVESRGKVVLTSKGPADGTTLQSAPNRFFLPATKDKKRSEIELERGKLAIQRRLTLDARLSRAAEHFKVPELVERLRPI